MSEAHNTWVLAYDNVSAISTARSCYAASPPSSG